MPVPGLLSYSFLHQQRMRETLDPALKAWLSGKKGLDVLDIGTLFSPWAPLVQPHARQYVKLDVLSRPGLSVLGRGERLPFHDNAFDLVLCTQVLEHVEQPFEVVQEIHRVLKPHGKVFLTTHGIWKEHAEPFDRWRFTPDGLRAVFKPFAAVRPRITPQGGSWLALMQLFNLWVSAWHRPSFVPRKLWFWARAPLYVLPNLLGSLDRVGLPGATGNTRLVQNYLVEAEK